MKFGDNYVPLGELGEIISGSTPDTTNKSYWEGDIPWITPADLTDHHGIYFRGNLRKITKAGYNSCSTKLLPPGSIVFSSRAPIGHCAVTTFSLCTNQGFKNIVPNEKLDPVYGFFVLKFFTPEIVALGRGATFSEINKEIFETFRIPLPPLPEQRRIAAILEKADRLRQQRRYALGLSDTYLQTVFLEMFGDSVTNPHHWPIGELSELCANIVDCPHATPIYSTEKTPYACIRSSDIQNGFLDWSTTKYVNFSEFKKRVKVTIPKPQDVVYCREGARFGNAAIIPNGKQVCLGQRTMLFRAASHLATPEYIWAFLESESTYRLAVKMAGGSAAPHLNVGDIKEFPITIPPLPLQQKFAQIVQKFERLRAQQREAERQAGHLFQTLLHRAFQGELTQEVAVQDAPGEEEAHSMNEPGMLYPMAAPAKLVVKETEQLALPME